jgi:hypothetical protein
MYLVHVFGRKPGLSEIVLNRVLAKPPFSASLTSQFHTVGWTVRARRKTMENAAHSIYKLLDNFISPIFKDSQWS